MCKFYIVDPVENRCRQINVVNFLVWGFGVLRDKLMTAIMDKINVIG